VQKASNTGNNRRIGAFSEDEAVAYMIGNGYEIIERNYHFRRYGEVDIIAKKDGYICFVEVKSRANNNFGAPSEAITRQKRKRIYLIAKHYISVNNYTDNNVRFDAVEIYLTHNAEGEYGVKSINLIENAF